MPKLVHMYSGTLVKEYTLEHGRLKIGRKPDNDICLDDITVSGQHASLSVQPNSYMDGLDDVYIMDLGSTNGTMVNGRPVSRHLLKHGDIVSVGAHEFTLVDENTLRLEETMIYIPDENDQ